MSAYMKAAVHERYGPPNMVMMRDVPMPRPAANEVLIQVHATTVSAEPSAVKPTDAKSTEAKPIDARASCPRGVLFPGTTRAARPAVP